ncbi:MAG: ABC transporter permease [Planctomycetaceae bacterium]|nr:ABC transporter permease [Planctomycetaceae bacterium]
MGFWLSTRIALRALAKNRLRAGLTIFGIVIGIAAVTAMVSLGQSASQLVQGQLESLGTNMLAVLPGTVQKGGIRTVDIGSLSVGDLVAIQEDCASVNAASPLVAVNGQVVFRSANWNPQSIFGVGEDYQVVRSWSLAVGTFLSERDIAAGAKVCVLGQTVVRELFQSEDPLGQTIRIKNTPFLVVGVLEAKGVSMFGQDHDDIVLIPFSTAAKRLRSASGSGVDAILVSTASPSLATVAAREVEMLLRDRHGIGAGRDADFRIQSTTEIALMLQVIMGAITLMLTAIAAISLVVGGVGIMNIMLVSVAERTREIGIRMAIGARSSDILRQFLIEAVVLSCLGGIIGIGLGMGTSAGLTVLVNWLTPNASWPFIISMEAAFVALVFSAMIGVFFGYYPARRASQLNPIEALRYE